MKGGRTHDKRVQTQTIPFRWPHAQDSIEPVVFILIMVCHDCVGPGGEVREFNNGRPFHGPGCLRFKTLRFIRKRVWRVEKQNADGLRVVMNVLYRDVERGGMTGGNG